MQTRRFPTWRRRQPPSGRRMWHDCRLAECHFVGLHDRQSLRAYWTLRGHDQYSLRPCVATFLAPVTHWPVTIPFVIGTQGPSTSLRGSMKDPSGLHAASAQFKMSMVCKSERRFAAFMVSVYTLRDTTLDTIWYVYLTMTRIQQSVWRVHCGVHE